MQLQLSLKEKEVSLVLQSGAQIVDEKKWTDKNNLLEKFFPIFDNMLMRNNMTVEDVDAFVLDTNIPDGYTTARIAQTIIKTFQFAHNS